MKGPDPETTDRIIAESEQVRRESETVRHLVDSAREALSVAMARATREIDPAELMLCKRPN